MFKYETPLKLFEEDDWRSEDYVEEMQDTLEKGQGYD